jgi:hypothetical protein
VSEPVSLACERRDHDGCRGVFITLTSTHAPCGCWCHEPADVAALVQELRIVREQLRRRDEERDHR